ncbi:MAG TPA: hypothetical protein VM533_12620 [Fimbriiglobus sp.]|jgi:hypothetical protein|nr:hypothetical protein [Fimbriiglobus sp.]
MATQRVVVLKVLGAAGDALAGMVRYLRTAPEPADRIDPLVRQLLAHRTELPVVSYVEWIDRWSMGDDVPRLLERVGGVVVAGRAFEVGVCDPPELVSGLATEGWQFDEQSVFVRRLREVAAEWRPLAPPAVLVVIREVLGASTLDEEVYAAAASADVPGWIAQLESDRAGPS